VTRVRNALDVQTPKAPAIPGVLTWTWRALVDPVSGASRDCTEGPVSKAVVLLCIPMVLEASLESLFAVTDIFFVGHMGASAVAAIGLTEALLSVVYTVAVGLGIGATATVARRVGARDLEGAAAAAVQALALGVLFSTVIAAAGVTFAPGLMRLVGGSEEVVREGTSYMRVRFGGSAAILLLFLGNAVFRGAGDGAIAMRALAVASGLNLVFVPGLVLGLGIFPEHGLTGAACAANLARGLAAAYALGHLFRGQGRVKVAWRHLALHPALMLRVLRLSGSGMLQAILGTASGIAVVHVVASFGSAAVAGYTIGMRVVLFAALPACGLANAAATMVGQSLGGGKPERAERAAWVAGLYNAALLGGVGIFFFVWAPVISGWFTAEAAVQAYAVACLRTVSCGFPLYAFGLVLTQAFNGAGDTWTPTLINCFVFWAFEIPAAYALSLVPVLGPHGVFLAITLAFTALAVVSAVLFRRGRWKLKRV
jgi:putative MATE family efflux protein